MSVSFLLSIKLKEGKPSPHGISRELHWNTEQKRKSTKKPRDQEPLPGSARAAVGTPTLFFLPISPLFLPQPPGMIKNIGSAAHPYKRRRPAVPGGNTLHLVLTSGISERIAILVSCFRLEGDIPALTQNSKWVKVPTCGRRENVKRSSPISANHQDGKHDSLRVGRVDRLQP